MSAEPITLQAFLRGEVCAARFPHREHVRMAFEILGRHDFAEALLRRWYRPEQLASALASQTFLLPDPPGERA